MTQVYGMDSHYVRAYDLLTSRCTLDAFDLIWKGPQLQSRYGSHPHSQAVLRVRRGVEAEIALVAVFWQNDGLSHLSVSWDTYHRDVLDLETRPMPTAGQAFSALRDDCDARGRLDETPVGLKGARSTAPRTVGPPTQPAHDPITPAEGAATIDQQLGTDPLLRLYDPLGRPQRLCLGEPIRDLLS